MNREDTASSTASDTSCAEFQEHLPEFFAAGEGMPDDPALQAHLDTCKNCSALVRDLQYIAQEARRLFQPSHDVAPSDGLWAKIHDQIKQETGNSPDNSPH